jgi:hypothetical protein
VKHRDACRLDTRARQRMPRRRGTIARCRRRQSAKSSRRWPTIQRARQILAANARRRRGARERTDAALIVVCARCVASGTLPPGSVHCDSRIGRIGGAEAAEWHPRRTRAHSTWPVAMIYEARPNVTADAAALCFYAAIVPVGGGRKLPKQSCDCMALHEARHARPAGLQSRWSKTWVAQMMQLLQPRPGRPGLPRGGEG